jgi:hypothetical protein
MTSRLSGPAGWRASAGHKQAFRRRTPPLPGSVAVAVLTAPTTVSGDRHGYDHTSALGDLPGGQRDDADDPDDHELSLSGNKSSEIFDRTKESGGTRQDR